MPEEVKVATNMADGQSDMEEDQEKQENLALQKRLIQMQYLE